MRVLRFVIVLLVFSSSTVLAVEPHERLDDPDLEARARVISLELRCLVCQNQSIDDSNAGLAKDLRVLVRERLKAGDTNSQVIDYVTARYGEFVLLRPRFSATNLLLWLGPLLIFLTGSVLAWRFIRSQPAAKIDAAPLTVDEQAKLDQLINQDRP
jgi:cytochrome c-type biogenesis protein CcmH